MSMGGDRGRKARPPSTLTLSTGRPRENCTPLGRSEAVRAANRPDTAVAQAGYLGRQVGPDAKKGSSV